jgi:hypothetical protein
MILLPLGKQRLQCGNADRTAEVARHVEQRGRGPGILRLDSGSCDRREQSEHKGMTNGTDHVRPKQLISRVVVGHVDVHEVGGSEKPKANADQDARIDTLHQPRHQRNQHKLWQPRPSEHHADLFGIVALDVGETDRQNVD